MSALISVHDKTGVVEFAEHLVGLGHDLISTGGTLATLREAGLSVRPVPDVTGFPGMLDGRVKTLHPAIHGGILARRDIPAHQQQLDDLGFDPIDIVVVNLYPFASTLAQGLDHESLVEQIDIGGPTLIRSAAKNIANVVVVVDPRDYDQMQTALHANTLDIEFRNRLAAKAFAHTAGYDALIAAYYADQCSEQLPEMLSLPLTRLVDLRYGENPHQATAAFYRFGTPELPAVGLAAMEQLHGQQLSYNNYLDIDAAWRLVNEFVEPAVAAIKHGNPCGLAVDKVELRELYERVHACDPISIFGGIIATNRNVDLDIAMSMRGTLLDVIGAPSYDKEALAVLRKRRHTRILQIPNLDVAGEGHILGLGQLQLRTVLGGALLQEADNVPPNKPTFEVVSKRQPTETIRQDLAFAWKAIKHVKSNAIVLAKHGDIVGVGAGQMNRVDSVHMALRRAGVRAQGSVLASDAFFPFPDGPVMAMEGGVEAIIEPGGSVKDSEVIKAVDQADGILVFTGGERHFRH